MILSGEKASAQIRERLKEEISGPRPPKLSVILVGDDEASRVYVGMKERACKEIGILSEKHTLPATLQEEELLALIHRLNEDSTVDGILIQLPLPGPIDITKVFNAVSPSKDIDGFHPVNMGKLLLGESEGFIPCTPLGIQKLLQHYQIATEGKHVVIVGRSNLVGKPLAALLCQKSEGANATVTLVHSQSGAIKNYTRQADILVAACGQAASIDAEMVKEGAVVIDVGIHRLAGGKLVGDVDFASVQPKAAYITPVPGGVGPMTVAMLLHNTIKSYRCAIL